ncbi:serine carboxypeptidase-like 7 [Zea mays]|nr:serine carboxypeptidase-like 7 [Zea mays]|eukprot:XP_008669340.1 serine carboxypeptidase-like 7 [Zea mays]
MQSTAAMRSGGGGNKRSLLLLLSAWWLLLGSLVAQLPAARGGSGHVVTRMPGFDGPLPFHLETGYVEVDEQLGVQLFYYFVRSEKDDPGEDPLLLWLSGGPGCSGLSGLAYEIGPFHFDARGYRGGFPTLLYRPETWTKVSNIIFMDSPVGTGFSYATSDEGLKSSDTQAVRQLAIFLRKWLEEHPEFLPNPLYIGGDSYGGMIVPALALQIHTSTELGENPSFNLKGYVTGNPVTDSQFDTDGVVPFLHGMGLIPYEFYENAREMCGGKYSDAASVACAEVTRAIANITSAVNREHVLEPACPDDDDDELFGPKTTMAETDGGTSRRLMLQSADYFLPAGFKCRRASYVLSRVWANDETVQESLGVRKGTIGAWKRCNQDILYNQNVQSVVPYHSRLAAKGYRALIYSGDHDRIVPFVGTQAWIRYLNLTVVDDWRPWYVGGQVAGFTRNSGNLIYATVKGAGHTAPEYKPTECQTMFRKWVSRDPL